MFDQSRFSLMRTEFYSSVTHPSAAVFTCFAYLYRIPFVAFNAGCFQCFFLSAISSSETFNVIVFFIASISMISLSSTKANQSAFICFRSDMTHDKTMCATTKSSISNKATDLPKPAPIIAPVGFNISGIPEHLWVQCFLSPPHRLHAHFPIEYLL